MAAPATPSDAPSDPIEVIDDLLFGDERSSRAESQHREGGKFAKDPTEEREEEAEPKEARARAPRQREEAEESEEGDERQEAAEESEEDEQQAEGEDESEEASEEEAEDDESAVYTFGDLAKGLEIAEDELAAHLHVEGPDGESVPLSDVIKTYREQPERAQALSELHDERSGLQEERATIRKEKDEALNRLASYTQVLIQRINPEAAQAELAELRRSGDTQGYLIRKAEIEEEQGQVQRVLAEFDRETELRKREDAKVHTDYVNAEVKKLKSLMPEWKSREKAAAAMDEIGEYLRGRGYSEEEINGLVDHRAVLTVWEAIQYRRLGKSKPKVSERLEKLRKKAGKSRRPEGLRTLPAKARRGRDSTAARELRASRKRLRQTGSDEAADDFFGRIM